MNKEEAKRLIRETFQNHFDESRFRLFAKNLFNDLDESKAFAYQGQYIPDAYKDHVRQYKRLGKYTDPDEAALDVLVVNLKRETALDRARTMQRNFIAWYLKHRGEKDAAIVAYHTDGLEDWRFSYVRMDYRTERGETGKVRVKTDLTPARRYSFLVGQNENSHTAQTRFQPLLEDDRHNPTLDRIEEAFNIETVTQEFFEKYRLLFNELKEALDSVVAHNAAVAEDFGEKGVDTVNFAKKTLGQIVFLYFLQKKGWFGVARDKAWGTGPKNFLRQLFEDRKYNNFFNDILEPLFYEALARERDQNYYRLFDCKIPFLNGGLFDPINEYDWVHCDILLPDALFSNWERTEEGDVGTGILDIFDRYNFTVREDEPLEREVAVDPEMLGKVFENLLEVKDRKSKGTYYTPREIVHYMCRESLISHLDTELAGADSDLFLRREDLEYLIRYGERIREHDARVRREGKETPDYPYLLPAPIRAKADLIDAKLADIRVCDPAVGSGAFLVGMMAEIVKARQTLSTYIESGEPRGTYFFKRQAIQYSLYGVDIDPGAVEIAKLRLWLSLIVDEEDIREIKPLPNLDYKVMQGNSLLEEYEGIKLFDEKLITDSLVDETEMLIQEAKQKQQRVQREYFRLKADGKLTAFKKQDLELQLQELATHLKKLGRQAGRIGEEIPLFDSEAKKKADEIKQLHKDFFETFQKSRKDAIKARIEALEWELIEATLREQHKTDALKEIGIWKRANIRPFFLWKFHFAEVFREKRGFDVVIANPPYVRQESIKAFKPQLKQSFGCFYCGTAVLYTYFYKRGIEILKPSGHLCFIAPNKFMRAGYGEKTRVLLAGDATPEIVIDFGDLPIFDATTYPSILLIEKVKPDADAKTLAATFTDPSQLERLDETLAAVGFSMPIAALKPGGWTLERPEVLALMEKLRKAGKPLGDYVNCRFYRGITTGLNEAFVIDEENRQRLIAEDPKSAGLIKPWFRGRDIRKWKAEWAGLYVIFTRRGTDIKKYPAIKRHLEKFREALEPKKSESAKKGRKPGPYKWFEIQDNIAYFEEFEKTKIISTKISIQPTFSLDLTSSYLGNTSYFITVDSQDRYLLVALLNAKLSEYYSRRIFIGKQNGYYEVQPEGLEAFPIPSASDKQKLPIIERVQKILANPDSPAVPCLESEIDDLVYKLYGLTKDEVVLVEGQ
ncbi:MAG TPA: TaqI-like C-terminal specificity domain-containing protein [Geobacteraceae bacterium]|nr:TaqI-like C-terminal specificity domain-containing protein [Geobacteraceae bacterium]